MSAGACGLCWSVSLGLAAMTSSLATAISEEGRIPDVGGPIIRSYGVPNWDDIFGGKEESKPAKKSKKKSNKTKRKSAKSPKAGGKSKPGTTKRKAAKKKTAKRK